MFEAASEALECFDDPFWNARGRERTRCSISRSWPMLDAGGYLRDGDGAALADRCSIGIYAMDHGQNRAKSAKNPSYLNAVGMEFYDGARGYGMKYMYPDSRSPYAGWILYQYPDGQWITLRKATADDIAQLNRGVTRTQSLTNRAEGWHFNTTRSFASRERFATMTKDDICAYTKTADTESKWRNFAHTRILAGCRIVVRYGLPHFSTE